MGFLLGDNRALQIGDIVIYVINGERTIPSPDVTGKYFLLCMYDHQDDTYHTSIDECGQVIHAFVPTRDSIYS